MTLPPAITPSAARCALRALSRIALGALTAGTAVAACLDEQADPSTQAEVTLTPAPEPLGALVQMAVDRSQRIGATLLLRDAAAEDVRVEEAAGETRLEIQAGLGPAWHRQQGTIPSSPVQWQAGVTLSRLLHDGGHSAHRIEWRQHLRQAAELDLLSVREQIALRTVSTALERLRLRQHAVTLGQYVRQMGCLLEVMERSPASTPVRAQALGEARQAWMQAVDLQAQARQALRDSAPALRHLLGDGLPLHIELPLWLLNAASPSASSPDAEPPELAAFRARQSAAQSLLVARERAQEPQVHGFIGARTATGARIDRSSRTHAELTIGLNIRFDGWLGAKTSNEAGKTAAQQQAQAARWELQAVHDARRSRLEESLRQAQRAFDTARRLAELLRQSGRLRQPTLQEWQDSDLTLQREAVQALRAHYALRAAYLDALHAGQQSSALAKSLTRGLADALQ